MKLSREKNEQASLLLFFEENLKLFNLHHLSVNFIYKQQLIRPSALENKNFQTIFRRPQEDQDHTFCHGFHA